jgi:hypothetical protein
VCPKNGAASATNAVVQPQTIVPVSTNVVMAFIAADVVGEFWLGLNITNASKRGSSNGFIYEVEWYEQDGEVYELWDDGLDFVRADRLLVERVEFVDGCDQCILIVSSRARIEEALALRALNGTVIATDQSEKEMP